MDPTLRAILATLFDYSQTIDRLQAELQVRDQRIAELEALQHSGNGVATPGVHEVPV